MPHRPKQKTSKKDRAVVRARRSRQRKREKEDFAHIEYLKSQLDDKGQPIDILHTDEELLNNEQKFIVRIMNELSKFDPLSITNLIDDYYDDDIIDEIVDYYYANKENKSWSDRLFKATYNCLRVTNLTYLLKSEVLHHMDELFIQFSDKDVESVKTMLTEEMMIEIIEKCKSDIHVEINMAEIINSLLLVYIQNVQMCYAHELGGGSIKKIQSGGSIFILLLIFLIMIFAWFFIKHKISNISTEPKPLATKEDIAKLNMKVERDRQKRKEKFATQPTDEQVIPIAEDYANLERYRRRMTEQPHNEQVKQQLTVEDFAKLRMKTERDRRKKEAEQANPNKEN